MSKPILFEEKPRAVKEYPEESTSQGEQDIGHHQKHLRTAGFGGGMIRNDDFINNGLRPQVFQSK